MWELVLVLASTIAFWTCIIVLAFAACCGIAAAELLVRGWSRE